MKSYCTLFIFSPPIKILFLTPLFKLFFCPIFHFSQFLSLFSFHFLLCSLETPLLSLLSRNSSCSPETPLLSQNSDLDLGVVRGGWRLMVVGFARVIFFFIGCFGFACRGFARVIFFSSGVLGFLAWFFFSSGVLDLLAMGLLTDLGLSVVVNGFEMGLMGFD